MQKSKWKYVVFLGSIGLLIAVLERDRLKRLGKYVAEKWQDFIESFASKWEGIEEIGDNQSFGNKTFEKMMREVGWTSGDQWCMYFAKMVHVNAFPQEKDKIMRILDGSTQRSFDRARDDKSGTYTVITSGTPKKGDIAIWVRSDDSSRGHAGIVTSVEGDYFNTIEGNTDRSGSANGQTVKRLKRPLKYGQKLPNSVLKLRGFIRKIT